MKEKQIPTYLSEPRMEGADISIPSRSQIEVKDVEVKIFCESHLLRYDTETVGD